MEGGDTNLIGVFGHTDRVPFTKWINYFFLGRYPLTKPALGQELITQDPVRVELAFLDGIRGVAAMSVVIYHAFLFTGNSGDTVRAFPLVARVVGLGYLGVPLFIVLSGFVLMLPVCRGDGLQIPGGSLRFFRRRAKRILPPYFAALAITLLLIRAIPLLQQPSGTQWDSKVPVTVADVVSHALLVHDFSPEWIGKIDGPLWSVAIEWHIYFLMPLLLLPLWRRLYPLAVVSVLFAVTMVLGSIGLGNYLHPWFVPLFALGMAAAQFSVQPEAIGRGVGVLTAGILLAAPVTLALLTRSGIGEAWVTESTTGVLVAVFLAWAGRRSVENRRTLPAKVFDCPPLAWLGLFSYSLYLLHSPLLGLGNLLLRPLGLSIGVHLMVMLTVVVPLAVVACWVLFRCVEARFLNSRQRHVVENKSTES